MSLHRPFIKVEGLGNDFILVQGNAHELAGLAERAVALCDRRRGIGGDGILVVGPPSTEGAARTMWVINHDGSRPEMCGNGLRCVALWTAATAGNGDVIIDTDDGPKRCLVTPRPDEPPRPGQHADVEVDMGPARRGPTVTPAAGDGRSFAQVSMGNPHAIAFVNAGEDPAALARGLGPGIEVDPAFPEGTNVELAAVLEDGIVLWVWERGCGITDACGTGACATAAAAVDAGRCPADTPIRVRLPGGVLTITVPSDPGRGVRMTGPARLVFRGELA